MSVRGRQHLIIALFFSSLTVPISLHGQGVSGPPAPGGIGTSSATLRGVLKQTWEIHGRVTDLKGEPLHAAAVRVDIGMGPRYVRKLTTNVQGEFSTEYTLDTNQYPHLVAHLAAERDGYRPAHDYADFGDSGKTWETDIAMQPEAGGADELPVETLVGWLAPPLRARLENDAANRHVEKDLQRGVADFLDHQDAVKALPSLDKVVKRRADCGDCRTLLGLALLEAGSWRSASREFAEANRLAEASGTAEQKVASLLILGELENWMGEYSKAAGFLVKARDLEPKNAFVLQELGRTLILQGNWEAAEENLAQAARLGAPRDTHLLRARALLEGGEPEQADAEMRAYLGGESLAHFPPAVRNLCAQIQTRVELRAYGTVQSALNQPLPALLKAVPELKGLEPAASQEELATILDKAGQTVKSFFVNFPNTVSQEQVREERVGRNGKAHHVLEQKFQYLLLAKAETWGLGLDEFRTNEQGAPSKPTGLGSGFMLTSGFASASLLFHPAYQSGASFRYLGRQSFAGRACYVVAFAQIPEKALMVEQFVTDKDSVLVLAQGVAWIDAETYRILRLRTDLLKPQPAIRLARQTTEIVYDPVQFKQIAAMMWLPSEVKVTVEWRGKTYRNLHHYSDFKLFNTDAKEKIHPVAPPPSL